MASEENAAGVRLGVWWIAEDQPSAVAIAHSPDGTFTYGQLAARSHQLVHTFRELGIQPGAAIAVLAPNGVTPIEVTLACQEAGWNLVLINGYLTPAEVLNLLEHSRAEALVLHAKHGNLLDCDIGGRIRSTTRVLGVCGVNGVPDLTALARSQPTQPPIDRREGGMISYSSGTTGAPKAILRAGSGGDPSAAAHRFGMTATTVGFRPFGGPFLVSTALYHGGSHGYCMRALHLGHRLVIMDRFDAATALDLINAYEVRTAFMVPTQFHRLLQLPSAVRSRAEVSSLEAVIHTAAPCPVELKRAMIDWWGPVIFEMYGGMEGVATVATSNDWLEHPGTVGRAAPGVRLAILDDDGNELESGAIGNIFYETSAGFTYMFDESETRAAYRGSRFTIGDIGYVDDDGYLFICDRAKDMIVSGGVNVFPAEVEAVLLTHPAVADVAVIGIPDPEWGEQVLALVELADGYTETEELRTQLAEHGTLRLAAHKRPRRIEIAHDLPRTEAGKMYKRLIRERYWQEAGRAI